MEDPVLAFLRLGQRATDNARQTLESMTPRNWIRLLVIVCGYALFRRYVLLYVAKRQARLHEATSQDADDSKMGPPLLSANSLRGRVQIPDDSDDEERADVTSATATDWGKKARRRQRDVLRRLVDAEERKLREQLGDDDDADIEELLTG